MKRRYFKRPVLILPILLFVLCVAAAVKWHRPLWLAMICYNLDHVDLQRDGFLKIFDFRTEKGTLVEVYARRTTDPHNPEFVIARKGLFPLGIRAITPVQTAAVYWDGYGISTGPDSMACNTSIRIGCTVGLCGGARWQPAVSMQVAINKSHSGYEIYSVVCGFCDDLTVSFGPVPDAVYLKPIETPKTKVTTYRSAVETVLVKDNPCIK